MTKCALDALPDRCNANAKQGKDMSHEPTQQSLLTRVTEHVPQSKPPADQQRTLLNVT